MDKYKFSTVKEKVRISTHIDKSLEDIKDIKMREMVKAFIYSGDDRVIMTKYYSYFPTFKPYDWVDVWE
jgi:hypothetical protein